MDDLEKQAVLINGDITSPFLITIHLIRKYPVKIFILQSCATHVGILHEKNELSQYFF